MWSEVYMRGLQNLLNKFRYAKQSKAIVASFFVMAVMLTGVGVYQFNQTSVDAASVCNNQNNIVPNGTHSYGDVTNSYNANTCGDLQAIYNHYWIKPNLAAGDRVLDGTSNNRGEVIADGRVVANNAASIGRQAIMHSQPISINGQTYYQTSHVGGQAFANPNASLPTLVVLDAAGNFKYAIIKACGNPIYATPVNPPKPPEPPKPVTIKVCELATKKIVTINEDQFNPSLYSKNLKDCEEKYIKVCELATKKIVTIKESEFNPTQYSKNLDDCKEVLIQVCDLKTKKIVTINEDQFNPTKYSKNLEDCKTPEKMVVCELATKKVITINKDQFDASKYSTNLKDCEAKCPIPGKEHLPATSAECEKPITPTSPELPKTGPEDILGAGVGLAAMGLTAYYYAASRRNLF